jgi:SOS response regulatory protein OraA/RecX
VAIVTALRAERRGRVTVELDGVAWRVVPAEAALRAGLDVGRELDRPSARQLRRELVRLRAIGTATRALKACDVSTERLRGRLDRAGIAPQIREEAVAVLGRAGLVDDARFASKRALALSERGYGDAAIAADLERQGIAQGLRETAVAQLEPEPERAWRIVERRGHGPRTARYLQARGFGEAALEAAVDADFANDP